MQKVLISTDTSADMFLSQMRDLDVRHIVLPYIENGTPVYEVPDSREDVFRFYDKIEHGLMPTTSQLNEDEYRVYFEKLLAECAGDVLHFSLSSGLSASYFNAARAAAALNKALTGRRVCVFDTLGATQTIAALVEYAAVLRDGGTTAEEILPLITQKRDGQQAWIIVNNLQHLKRGGRVGGAAAAVGTVFNIKPIINVDDAGKLSVQFKERGLNHAVNRVIKLIADNGIDLSGQTIIPVHTGRATYELAQNLGERMVKKFGCKMDLRFIGPVIGAHTGADTFAVLAEGKPRIRGKG
jgi:DegV family protein with EDD domain